MKTHAVITKMLSQSKIKIVKVLHFVRKVDQQSIEFVPMEESFVLLEGKVVTKFMLELKVMAFLVTAWLQSNQSNKLKLNMKLDG